MRVLAGDVGGTKTLLAIFELQDSGVFQVVRDDRFKSQQYRGLEEVLNEFQLNGQDGIDAACFAVAGPIEDGRCRTSNLPWHLDTSILQESLALERLRLINDFHAIGYGLDLLKPNEMLILQEGERDPQGPRAILGAGTGLGEAFMIWTEQGYRAYASEGSHVDFAPRNGLEIELLQYLQEDLGGRISYDRVIAGSGLHRIYRFLISSGRFQESKEVHRDMTTEGADPAAVISKHALKGSDLACVRALHTFVSLYGAEAGNLALKIFSTGGVYVAGGIAPRIQNILQDGTFLEAFHDKGRFRSLMERLPVNVILEPRVGLLGAAAVASGLEKAS